MLGLVRRWQGTLGGSFAFDLDTQLLDYDVVTAQYRVLVSRRPPASFVDVTFGPHDGLLYGACTFHQFFRC